MKLEHILYELRPYLLIGIALLGFSSIGWNVATISGCILVAASILIIHWRMKSRQNKPPRR